MIQLNYRDARPIYEQIVEGVHNQIAAGILLPEDKLPSVRELAGQLSINPNTIQRAYREMENQGFAKTVPGKGCFVCGAAEKKGRWQELDKAVDELLAQGITREEIARRILKGGT